MSLNALGDRFQPFDKGDSDTHERSKPLPVKEESSFQSQKILRDLNLEVGEEQSTNLPDDATLRDISELDVQDIAKVPPASEIKTFPKIL